MIAIKDQVPRVSTAEDGTKSLAQLYSDIIIARIHSVIGQFYKQAIVVIIFESSIVAISPQWILEY